MYGHDDHRQVRLPPRSVRARVTRDFTDDLVSIARSALSTSKK
jgi:hypothetical protein